MTNVKKDLPVQPDYYVSQWNNYPLPAMDQTREMAVYDNNNNCLIDRNGEVYPFVDPESFIKLVTDRRMLIFTYRVLEMKCLIDLLGDKRVKPRASRTQGIIGLYIKSRKSAWVVEKRIWEEGHSLKPDSDFLEVMDEVFRVNGRCAPTPGSLGERKIRETLPQIGYSRPSHMLRKTLLDNKVGGRADTTEVNKQYDVLYENDINSAYPYCACETIDPSEHPKRFFSDKDVGEYFSYYAHIRFFLPIGSKSVKFGPLPVRDNRGHLQFPTVKGKIYEGWYWKEEIDQALQVGYNVEIIEGYGWRHSSRWLEKWANEMYRLRIETDGRVRDIIKKEMVAAIGRFGMAPEKLTLVPAEESVPGDIPVIIQASGHDETSISEYFVHVEDDLQCNALTHIASYVVSKCRTILYTRILEEETAGGTVVLTNFDSVYTTKYTKLTEKLGSGLGEWRSRKVESAYIHAPRSISGIREGIPIDKRPGVRKELRSEKTNDQRKDSNKDKRKHRPNTRMG